MKKAPTASTSASSARTSRARPPSWPRPARPSQTGRISSTPGSPATPTSRQTPPEILKDFLENWKQHAIGYYREKRIRFIEYREGLKAKERAARLEALQTLPSLEKYRELYKGRELTDYDLANLWPRRDVDAFLSERGLEYHQIQKKLREAGDQITLRLLEIRDEDEREAWLEKTMDEEKRAKLLDLISRIMSTVGTITDAAALYIGPEGDINGIIVGTEGKAKIQTIGAGGYNIQCFHFRTLIHEIK